MKKIFRRLACCLFCIGACIGCFDTEARSPRYQGELAAEKLVEKAWADLESFVNGAYTKKQFIYDIICMICTNDEKQSLATWMPVCIDIYPLVIFRLIAGERKLNCRIPLSYLGEICHLI